MLSASEVDAGDTKRGAAPSIRHVRRTLPVHFKFRQMSVGAQDAYPQARHLSHAKHVACVAVLFSGVTNGISDDGRSSSRQEPARERAGDDPGRSSRPRACLTGAISPGEVAALAHEVSDHPVERRALVVEVLAGPPPAPLTGAEGSKVLCGPWHHVSTELNSIRAKQEREGAEMGAPETRSTGDFKAVDPIIERVEHSITHLRRIITVDTLLWLT